MEQDRIVSADVRQQYSNESWGTSYHDVSPDVRMWDTARDTGIPKRLARWKQAELASQTQNAQVEQHESSSRDIKLDLSVALSYETDIILEHQGERNVPQRYLKEACWDAHNEPDGTIDLGYFAQDRNRNYIAVDFDFNTLTWGWEV